MLETDVAHLVRYDAACRAIAEARTIDEAKEIRDTAEAMRAYARMAKNRQMEMDAVEIRVRAERRCGQIMAMQRETVGLNPGGGDHKSDHWVHNGPGDPRPTLNEAGIDKHLADRARKLALIADDTFEQKVAGWRDWLEDEAERVSARLLLDDAGPHVRGTFGTGENEWFTPAQYIAVAREVLGEIDLDPASHQKAQRTVQAKRYFTKADNGLLHEWRGRVWLNPPYAPPLIGQFVAKLIEEFVAGRVSQAILLTHNYTDTAWFHAAAASAELICFTRGRVRFIDVEGNECAPTQGQAFFYFGANAKTFRRAFGGFGFVR